MDLLCDANGFCAGEDCDERRKAGSCEFCAMFDAYQGVDKCDCIFSDCDDRRRAEVLWQLSRSSEFIEFVLTSTLKFCMLFTEDCTLVSIFLFQATKSRRRDRSLEERRRGEIAMLSF